MMTPEQRKSAEDRLKEIAWIKSGDLTPHHFVVESDALRDALRRDASERLEKLEKVVSEHLGEHRAVNSVFSPDDILKELRSIVERIVAVKSVFVRQKRYATGAEIRNVERVLLDFIERLS